MTIRAIYPNLRGLDDDQAQLADRYWQAWVSFQQTPNGDDYRDAYLLAMREARQAMTDKARLRCSQAERRWLAAKEREAEKVGRVAG